MATINLGAIKFNWKGPYNNSTTYAVDDVVSSGGSSYVCILASTGNAVSNGTYWQVLAEGGDVATTLTTQGDILYRDGSGLQRLAAGTSGQALLTGGAGANPSWGSVTSKIVNVAYYQNNTEYSTTNNSSYLTATNHAITYTPSSASNKLLVNWIPHVRWQSGSSDCSFRPKITTTIGGSASTFYEDTTSVNMYWYDSSGGNRLEFPINHVFDYAPNTTSAISFTVEFRNPHSTREVRMSDANNYSKWIIWEYTT